MTDLLDKGFSAAYFFLFITLKISCHSFLACQVSAGRLVTSLIGLPLYVRARLSLAAFRIFSLSLYFASFTMICRAENQVMSEGSSLCLLDFNAFFLPQIREVSAIISSSTPSAPFPLSSSSGIPIMCKLFLFSASLSSLIFPSYSWIFFYLSFCQLLLFP